MNLLLRFVAWLAGLFTARQRAVGAADERMRANDEAVQRLQRQNEVAKKPVTDAQLDKNLRDGTF